MFKIGIAYSPEDRWNNNVFGYATEERWMFMDVIMCAGSVEQCRALEIDLIARLQKVPGCYNIKPGGEGIFSASGKLLACYCSAVYAPAGSGVSARAAWRARKAALQGATIACLINRAGATVNADTVAGGVGKNMLSFGSESVLADQMSFVLGVLTMIALTVVLVVSLWCRGVRALPSEVNLLRAYTMWSVIVIGPINVIKDTGEFLIVWSQSVFELGLFADTCGMLHPIIVALMVGVFVGVHGVLRRGSELRAKTLRAQADEPDVRVEPAPAPNPPLDVARLVPPNPVPRVVPPPVANPLLNTVPPPPPPMAEPKPGPKRRARPAPPQPAPPEPCPKCRTPMVFKRARGGGCFMGCSRYPDCDGSGPPARPS